MKILFMGTPWFGAEVLRALIGRGHEIVLAVTQPDREKGRGKAVQMSPVKEEALAHGIRIYQPLKIRAPEAQDVLRQFSFDVGTVAAFGQILPQSVLDMPARGCINVHASLLPMYRGAAPIQKVILDGCSMTGVTTMQMDAGLDTGDILLQREIPIAADETGGSLTKKLAAAGAQLLLETLDRLEAGTLPRRPQEGPTCMARMLKKESGHMDFSQSAQALERFVRAMDPWPSAYCFHDGKRLEIWKAAAVRGAGDASAPSGDASRPGTVESVEKTCFDIRTGNGCLRVLELQPEGRKRMAADAFLRGYPLKPGEILE